MTDLSPDTLAAIKARADAATQGQWNMATAPHDPTTETQEEYLATTLSKGAPDASLYVCWVSDPEGEPDDYLLTAVTGNGPTSAANAAFIAAARTDVPALIAAYEAVTAERDTLKATLDKVVDESLALCDMTWLQRRDRVGGYSNAQPLHRSAASGIEECAHELRSLLKRHGFDGAYYDEAYRRSLADNYAKPSKP